MKKLLLALLLAAWPGFAAAQFTGAGLVNPTPKTISFTRDLTVASGNVAYTGCGFRPRGLIGIGGINGISNFATWSGLVGGAAGSSPGHVGPLGASNATAAVQTSFLGAFDSTGGNNQVANVLSYDVDGFTLTWTKAGTPTGTVTFFVMCLF